MKVKELIEELQKVADKDMEVAYHVYDEYDSYYNEINDVDVIVDKKRTGYDKPIVGIW